MPALNKRLFPLLFLYYFILLIFWSPWKENIKYGSKIKIKYYKEIMGSYFIPAISLFFQDTAYDWGIIQ